MAIKIPILAQFQNQGIKDAVRQFRALETRAQKFQFIMAKATSPAGLAAMAGAATTAAYAIWDMANAAADDQKSQAILASALRNTVGATDAQIASTEALITKMQMASGIADTDLRTGFQNLARATNDVTKSQELLALATDISVGTGRSLESVTIALGRAYNGNFGALTRLGVNIDANAVAAKNFEGVTRDLANTFAGSATAAADTFAGQMAIANEKVSEAKETIGALFIPVLGELVNMAADAANSLIYLGDAFGYLTKKAQESKWWRALIGAIPVIGDKITNTVAATDQWTGAIKKNYGTSAEWLGAIGAAPTWIDDTKDSVDQLTKSLGGSSAAFQESETAIQRYLRMVGEAAATITDSFKSMFDIGGLYSQSSNLKQFMGSVKGTVKMIKDYGANLLGLQEAGLSPIAIQGIMSMDLISGSQLAQDLLRSGMKNIRQLNKAYRQVGAVSEQVGGGLALGAMGGTAPVTQYITITNPNPKAVVQQLREYGRNSGPLPIAVTGSF